MGIKDNIYPQESGSGVLFGTGEQATGTVYLDRLYQWDTEKYNRCAEKHFGDRRQSLGRTTPQQTQDFLSDYLGRSVVVVKITRTTGYFDGYWYYQIDYRE